MDKRSARMTFLKWTFPLALILFGTAAAFAAPVPRADIVFENGTIYTADAEGSRAEFLAVRDERILFVGSRQEGQDYIAEDTETVDMQGGLMLPGFFDTHVHLPGNLWLDLFDFDFRGASTLDDVMARIEDYVSENPEKEAYFGFGYPTDVFPGDEAHKGPRKERLDMICPDKPVAIFSFDGHAVWLNSQALEHAGITASTVEPSAGVIEKDEAGELWGTLKEGATILAPKLRYSPEEMLAAIRRYQARLASYGFTSILAVPGLGSLFDVPWDELALLNASHELTLKVNGAVLVAPGYDLEKRLGEIRTMKRKYEGGYLRLNTVKLFADGVVDARTAYLLDPYEGEEEYRGEPFWRQEVLNETVAGINAAGLQAHVHCIGDAAARSALDAFEYAKRRAPAVDSRNTITHLQVVHEHDLPRFQALGVIASTQPYWHYRKAGYWSLVEFAALGARAEREYPLRSLSDAGARLSFSSNSPVTIDPIPVVAMETGVTRNSAAAAGMDDTIQLLNPAERLTIEDMIRGFTVDAAFATFCEDRTGSLETGKAADLAILDRNILAIPAEEIGDAEVVRTYVDGRLVYERK